jgi:DNA replication and repair protein RecF
MYLSKLNLVYFRNHKSRTIEFEGPTTVLVGVNTIGKTNILEAIHLLATGDSFRDCKIEEMVNFESEVGHITGVVTPEISNFKFQISNNTQSSKSNDQKITPPAPSLIKERESDKVDLMVTVTRGMVQGKRVMKRRYLVNGVPRRKQDFVGNLLVVSFRPEDMRIVEGSPARRRGFIDNILIQTDKEYIRALSSYQRGLIRRNRLLEMIKEGRTSKSTLLFWDQLIIKSGMYLQKKRRELEEWINNYEEYDEFGLKFNYNPSLINEMRLKQYEMEEVAAGHTLVGPHRDDYLIMSKLKAQNSNLMGLRRIDNIGEDTYDRDLAVYGSRGEQRMGVLWLTMMALDFIEFKNKVRPMLLLDDIFSELDHEHRKLVFGLMGRQQTVATTADIHYLDGLSETAQIIRL